ncbi:MAG: hypothetical protein V3W41_06915 [Planctomycetota bacterium]
MSLINSQPAPRDSRQNGTVLIEAVIVVLLAFAATFFWRSGGKSDRILRNEGNAIEDLRALVRVQTAYRNSHSRFGFLDELDESQTGWRVYPRRRGESGPSAIRGGYCLALYLSSDAGEEMGLVTGEKPRDDFWIAYAWPLEFGLTGRRLFSIDLDGTLRAWENQLGTFDGPDRRPAAAMAPDTESRQYPFHRGNQGYLGKVRWRPVEGTRP